MRNFASVQSKNDVKFSEQLLSPCRCMKPLLRRIFGFAGFWITSSIVVHGKISWLSREARAFSKAYHVIERFSEDIDLILDWRLLGYSADEPWQERSQASKTNLTLKSTKVVKRQR